MATTCIGCRPLTPSEYFQITSVAENESEFRQLATLFTVELFKNPEVLTETLRQMDEGVFTKYLKAVGY